MRGFGVACLLIGIVLLVYGLTAGDTFTANMKEGLTATAIDRSKWLLVGGVGLVVVGGSHLFMRYPNAAAGKSEQSPSANAWTSET